MPSGPHPTGHDAPARNTTFEASELHRRLARWLADVAPPSVGAIEHTGPCGQRVCCVLCGAEYGPYYPSAELLGNGDLLFHCHRAQVRLTASSPIRWIVP